MSLDIKTEQLVALRDIGNILPSSPHASTVGRWHQSGVRGIRLETVLLGGQRYTSHGAIQRFVDAVTAAGELRGAAPVNQDSHGESPSRTGAVINGSEVSDGK